VKRTAFLLIGLSLTCLALVALAQPTTAAPPGPKVVVVDPNDLRQPVPDPELGLSQKYNTTVQFSGKVTGWSQDKVSKKFVYSMVYEIVHKAPAKGKGKKGFVVVAKETINVAVTFKNDEQQLRFVSRPALGKGRPVKTPRKPGYDLAVQGTGNVQTDGTLVITDASVVQSKTDRLFTTE
jgi:hypothetical protein